MASTGQSTTSASIPKSLSLWMVPEGKDAHCKNPHHEHYWPESPLHESERRIREAEENG